MTVEVIYQGALRTEAKHIKSGKLLKTDAPTDNRGKGESFSPTDLVAVAHATCILTIMGIRAMDEGIDMEGTKATNLKVMAPDPRRIVKLEVHIYMPDKTYTESEKEILTQAAYETPVKNSLHPDLEEKIFIHW